MPIAALIGAVIFVGWILALISLITQHSIFGWGLPHGMPLWVGIIGLFLLYSLISAPFKDASRRHQAAAITPAGARCTASCGSDSPLLFFWLAYNFFPGFQSSWTSSCGPRTSRCRHLGDHSFEGVGFEGT